MEEQPPPRMSGGTYYQILNVTPTANSDEIKLQYRKLALKLHPDKNRDNPDATEKFQELQEAYEVLSDPERRTSYDANSDFILKAFADAGGDDRDNFLCIPSSRTFWCLMVEAAMSDEGKTLTAYAGQLEDELFDELRQGGVCGFTLLHFAAFMGKPRAVQALIELGANVNAKTQPLCVTPSQQFCRPTPLDLTIFIQNKRAKEATQKVLMAADGQHGGVDMSKLEGVMTGLIKHQLMLIRDEVLKFTSKIPTGVRRVLRTEPRWRDVIHFPGEDAAAIESRRTRKALRKTASNLWWVVFGDSYGEAKFRWGVRAWNFLICWYSWWLFGLTKVDFLPAMLVALVLMLVSCIFRMVPPEEFLARIPTKKQIQQALPPREKIEDRLELSWKYVVLVAEWLHSTVVFLGEEFETLRDIGVSDYVESAKERFSEHRESVNIAAPIEEDWDEDGPAVRKKPKGVANRIAKLLAEKAIKEEGSAGCVEEAADRGADGGGMAKEAARSAGIKAAKGADGPRKPAKGKRKAK